jgi:hypothetical protein
VTQSDKTYAEFRHATLKCLFNLILIFPENGYVTEEIKHSISVLRLDLFIKIPTSHKGKVWVSCAYHEGIWGVGVYIYSVLTFGLESFFGTHLIAGGCLGPRAGWDALGKREISFPFSRTDI